jgi:hypothetical protein
MDNLLTLEEQEAIACSADLAESCCAIFKNDHDLNEVIASIHDVQARLMARAAARAYPEWYRLDAREPNLI